MMDYKCQTGKYSIQNLGNELKHSESVELPLFFTSYLPKNTVVHETFSIDAFRYFSQCNIMQP